MYTFLGTENAKAPHCSFIENQCCNFGLTFEMANSKGGPAMFGSKWHLSRNAHLPKRRSQSAVLKTCAPLLPSPLQAKKGKRVSDDSFWTFSKKKLAL
jgi:hypothetical protein